jgi:hypothetical protein
MLAKGAAGQIIQNIPDAPLASDLTEPNYRQITSRNRNESGMVRPMALAVVRSIKAR